MIIGEPVSFFFSAVGDVTRSTWAGEFKVRPLLSFAGLAQVESYRRSFMGNPIEGEQAVNEEIRNIATMIAQIRARIIEAPSWVKESNYLSDFVDANVLIDIFQKIMDAEQDYRNNLSKKSSEALKEMKPEAK